MQYQQEVKSIIFFLSHMHLTILAGHDEKKNNAGAMDREKQQNK